MFLLVKVHEFGKDQDASEESGRESGTGVLKACGASLNGILVAADEGHLKAQENDENGFMQKILTLVI